MAENKKGFILYADLLNTVSKLPDVKAGKLFKIILEYVNDLHPKVDDLDLVLQIAFEPVKAQLKRDLRKYESKHEKLVASGKRGGLISGLSRRNKAKRSLASKIEANEAVTVTDTVTVSSSASLFEYFKIHTSGIPDHILNDEIEKFLHKYPGKTDPRKNSKLLQAWCSNIHYQAPIKRMVL